jgi:uncharacterized protein YprB with RNaseH-like and TPR domain
MKVFKKYVDSNVDQRINLPSENIVFLDIETTGLSSKYHYIYMIGILYLETKSGNWCIEQLFAENPAEENMILQSIADIITPDSILVTYNGETFDIPFIKNRMMKYSISYPQWKSFDLLKFLRANSTYLELENYRLTTVERYLGIFREDMYTGKDCIGFYKEFVKTRSEDLLDILLLHNFEDLKSMPDLLRILDLIEERKTIVISTSNYIGKIIVNTVNIENDMLVLKGTITPLLSSPIRHFLPSSTTEIQNNGELKLSLEIIKAKAPDETPVTVVKTNPYPIDKLNLENSNLEAPEGFLITSINKKINYNNIRKLAAIHFETIIAEHNKTLI